MSCRVSTQPGELGSGQGPTRPPGKRAGRSSLRGARCGDRTGRGKGPITRARAVWSEAAVRAQPRGTGSSSPLRPPPSPPPPSPAGERTAHARRRASAGHVTPRGPAPFPAGRSLGASRALGGRGECPRGAPASRTGRAWAGTPPAERLAGPPGTQRRRGTPSQPSPQPGVRVARPGARRGEGSRRPGRARGRGGGPRGLGRGGRGGRARGRRGSLPGRPPAGGPGSGLRAGPWFPALSGAAGPDGGPEGERPQVSAPCPRAAGRQRATPGRAAPAATASAGPPRRGCRLLSADRAARRAGG